MINHLLDGFIVAVCFGLAAWNLGVVIYVPLLPWFTRALALAGAGFLFGLGLTNLLLR